MHQNKIKFKKYFAKNYKILSLATVFSNNMSVKRILKWTILWFKYGMSFSFPSMTSLRISFHSAWGLSFSTIEIYCGVVLRLAGPESPLDIEWIWHIFQWYTRGLYSSLTTSSFEKRTHRAEENWIRFGIIRCKNKNSEISWIYLEKTFTFFVLFLSV